MFHLSQNISLTIGNEKYIIKNDTVIELPTAIAKKEGATMPTATLTMEEILQLYSECGINQKAPQNMTSEEPKITMDYAAPTLYAQVPLVYSDKVNI